MTVVIDLGAARYGADYSIERLIERFEPTHLYAVDPNPDFDAAASEETLIHVVNAAAWIIDGSIGYRADGLNSWITHDLHAPQVHCFDLAAFIRGCVDSHPLEKLILKLDCEGAEYDLLPHLIRTATDVLLELVIVEWHPKLLPDAEQRRKEIEERIRCPIEEWPY